MIDFVNTKTEDVAKELLGCLLVHEVDGEVLSGYIVDVEAYLGEEDAASHSYKGRKTPSVEAMYKEGGHLYLYTMRGHILLNFITGTENEPHGVMIRAIEPYEGIDTMKEIRQMTGSNLTNGPAKLTQALKIDLSYYGKKHGDTLRLDFSKKKKPKDLGITTRIGIPNKGKWTKAPLRYYVKGNPYVSRIRKRDIDTKQFGWI